MQHEPSHEADGPQSESGMTNVTVTTGLRAIEIDPHTDPRWKPFVRKHPNGMVYHYPEWMRIVERTTGGLTPAHLACEDETGNLRGVLPLFWRKGVLTGTSLSSMPYTRLAGPLTESTKAGEILIDKALNEVEPEPGARLKIKCLGTQLDDVHHQLSGGPWIKNFILDLPEPEAMMDSFSSRRRQKLRRVVRNAEKNRIRVRIASRIEELQAWYRLYLQAMKANGAMPRPWQFFELCWDILRPAGLIQLSLVEQKEADGPEIIAGSIDFFGAETVTGGYRGRSEKALHVEAHDLLTYHSIVAASNAGYKRFDMGEASDRQPGLQQYKVKWGCKQHTIYRYYYPEEGEIDTGSIAEDRLLGRMARVFWNRMPASATARISQVLHQYV